ncbi:S8 family serine peptidase [Actinomadura rupiterrae]|uniref:S8 family serine peptidase n=1 Tax=Actinomadura rupiterrae TaxID=559627 RepID=UPI0020A537F8|nr:S8 family serine peptidase [Actinomadura rupiterrae]MCP2341532.1 hypothetical protein [Actinomadura rupiterrae]
MDPHLAALLAGAAPDQEIGVLVRLRHRDARPPAGLRTVARFGPVLTARARARDVPALRRSRQVASVKAPRLYGPDVEAVHPEDLDGDRPLPRDLRRPPGLSATGDRTMAAFIDWGLDVAHPDFREEDGRTRVAALWDQRPGPVADRRNRYGYGLTHTRRDIDAALATADPYTALRYHPADSDPGGGAHGTHTCCIAAGNGRGGGPSGIAPQASIGFVQLSTWGPRGPDDLGDSIALLEAVDFLDRAAGDRPLVVNLSLGHQSGRHNGRTLVEIALDEFAGHRAGRSCVHSLGNYFGRHAHASGRVPAGGCQEIAMVLPAPPRTAQLDLWYPGEDRIDISLDGPGLDPAPLPLGATIVRSGGTPVAVARHRTDDPDDGRNELVVEFTGAARPGPWRLTLRGTDIIDGRYDAWLERPLRGQAAAAFTEPDRRITTGSVCNGRRGFAVGATGPSGAPTSFSSSGPTADGRMKPDLVAPGAGVLAARSTPRGAAPGTGGLTRMSGTSMAAPHVTGTVALLYSDGVTDLAAIRRLLAETATALPEHPPERTGAGLLNTAAALRTHPRPEQRQPDVLQPDPSPPEATVPVPDAPELHDPPAAASTVVVPEPGDLLVRHLDDGRDHISVVVRAGLHSRADLAATTPLERGPDGAYAVVTDLDGGRTPGRTLGRLLLGPDGRVAPLTTLVRHRAAARDPIADLRLSEPARTGAALLLARHPGTVFTSGRRDARAQAHAMAVNVVANRRWIEQTYSSEPERAELQQWVDHHPAATADQIAAGLRAILDGWSDARRARLSKHFGGLAFDVQPVTADADQIKADIRALPGLDRFLDREGGITRWHAQFNPTP